MSLNLNNPEDILITDNFPEGPLFNDVFPVEPPFMIPTHLDLVTLNSRLEHLSLEVNTQSLWIEVERAKRHKMHLSIKQLKKEMSPPYSDVTSLKQEMIIL